MERNSTFDKEIYWHNNALKDMKENYWNEMEVKARNTIGLSLVSEIKYNVLNETSLSN